MQSLKYDNQTASHNCQQNSLCYLLVNITEYVCIEYQFLVEHFYIMFGS